MKMKRISIAKCFLLRYNTTIYNQENIRGSRFLLCKPCKMMEARKPGLRARLSCFHDAGKKTVLIVRGYHDKRTSETRRDLAALQEPSL